VLVIKCAKCKQKIFKYVKIGKGQLLHCWRDRIVEDFGIHDGKYIKCKCGNIIGIDEIKWIKIRRKSVITTGTKF